MSKIYLHDSTIDRLEKITGKKALRGLDKTVNEALDILQLDQAGSGSS